jgi:hypothetical protein
MQAELMLNKMHHQEEQILMEMVILNIQQMLLFMMEIQDHQQLMLRLKVKINLGYMICQAMSWNGVGIGIQEMKALPGSYGAASGAVILCVVG